jgi:hypothetical protein
VILITGMNGVLAKPFTKDSLLEILERHLDMKQMQEMGYPTPEPMKNQQLVELTAESQQDFLAPAALDNPVSLDDPNLQFSYDQDYSAIFGAPTNATPSTFLQQSPLPPTSSGKRQTASERSQYEYLDQPRSVPRSAGVDGPKRVRYNTPPW